MADQGDEGHSQEDSATGDQGDEDQGHIQDSAVIDHGEIGIFSEGQAPWPDDAPDE
jgi:hypothetical protein